MKFALAAAVALIPYTAFAGNIAPATPPQLTIADQQRQNEIDRAHDMCRAQRAGYLPSKPVDHCKNLPD